jgi:hypothetical protein
MAERAIKPISEESMVEFEINYSAVSSGVIYFVDIYQ